MSKNKGYNAAIYLEAYERLGSLRAVARELNVNESTVREAVRRGKLNPAQAKAQDAMPFAAAGYDLARENESPAEAWNAHVDTFERTFAQQTKSHWAKVARPAGPFVVFHCTDPHVDDNATPLRLLEADIAAAHEMGSVMVHGGDLLNNWPMGGRLAKQWAAQECTAPRALLRARHYIDLLKPDVWVDGNHEEMNPYLATLIEQWLPEKTIKDYWTARVTVEPDGGDPLRLVVSHKLQKGASWFHPSHGALREGMEGEEADLYLEGHIHVSGIMYRTLPERRHSFVAVSSAGYKTVDKYAARISRGGVIPKIKGRCHWIVCDDQAPENAWRSIAFDDASRAEAYLSALQNLRAI
jgi:hypothetical protein